MAHENATPRPWRTTKTQPNVICNEGGNHWIARATIGKGSPRFIQDAGIAAANAALIVEAVNAYDTLRAENERLKADRLALYVWMRHVDWSECDLSEWLNNKPTALCIPDGNDGHAAAAKLYRELGGEDGFDYAKLRALSEAQP